MPASLEVQGAVMKRREFVRSSLAVAGFYVVGAGVRAQDIPDVAAITGDGRDVTLRGADIKDLANRLRGYVLLAGDDGYDAARHILNPSFDKKPALVVQPTGVADVQAAVRFARERDLLVAVKCGGHSHSGQSTCDKGMQLDLTTFRGVRVDPTVRRAWVAGGSLLGAVDHEAMAHGLVAPLGTVSHTGVGGLTLGGGFGRLARRFGMAIDNLESMDVVTSDGKLHRASAKDNRDLFWGLRGSGGNLGVVTMFEFRLHPMQREVIAGSVRFPIARARDVLSMWADYAPTAPDDLYMDYVMALPPGGAPGMMALEVCYSGRADRAEAVLAPIRKLGTPDKDTIKTMDYVAVQRMNDVVDARAMQRIGFKGQRLSPGGGPPVASYLKGGFIAQMPRDLIDAAVANFVGHPDRMTLLFCQHCGGASSRVPENATAFAQRFALANMMTVAAYPHGVVEPAEHVEATRNYWKGLEPFTRGFYVNDMAREATGADVNANFRGNYRRLVELKTQYDPTNLFRLNPNVVPKGAQAKAA
jgi:FAD/FMN-containing dehydrogenase